MYNEKDEDLLLFSSKFIKQKEYWVKKLSGEIPESGLPFARHESPSEVGEKRQKEVIIPQGLCKGLIRLGKQSDLSIYILLLAGLKSLIYRYTGSEDMVVISPVYQPRRSKGTLNRCVYIRTFLQGETTFKELILKVRQSLLEAYENQDYPFDRLEEHLVLGGSPLLCSMNSLHDEEDIGRIKSRLVFSFARDGESIRGRILYDVDTFDTFYIERMAVHFANILQDAVLDVDKRLSRLSVLSGDEEEKLLVEFSGIGARSDYLEKETVRRLFEHQVEKTPHGIAVEEAAPRARGIFPYAITYGQLNREANRLARLLKEKGITSNRIVGLMLEPSLELVIAALGILKAGGVFLPIDPGLPQSRILAMLKDCNASLLLTTAGIAGRFSLETFRGEILMVRRAPSAAGHPGEREENLPEVVHLDDFAYVIYTSGSTGMPKGVPITLRNLVPIMLWARDYFGLGSHTRVLQNLSFSFDFGVFEVLTTLISGGRLFFSMEGRCSDPVEFLEILNENRVNTLHTTPGFFNSIVLSGKSMPYLRVIHLGGEQVTGKLVLDTSGLISSDCIIYNGYGLTETTINNTIFALKHGEAGYFRASDNIPIGRPSTNDIIYILDGNHRVLPIGCPGELCIAGGSLARGYLNRPELTKERFRVINYKLQNTNHKHMSYMSYVSYRTGDLARWLPDGNIEFLGRLDQQVKIRGFRIELGEIESRLSSHKEIKEAVVVDRQREDGHHYLCAYIVPVDRLNTAALREYVGERLPEYMVPSYFVRLEELPLNPNGKIDRKSLPEPDEDSLDRQREYAAPTNEVEEKLVWIWQRILGRERIGIYDNFFELGGDSLLANQSIAYLREEMQVEFSLRDFFEDPSIQAVARRINDRDKAVARIRIAPAPRSESIPLSFTQEGIWVLYQVDKENAAYHVPRALRIKGQFEPALVERAFNEIIRRHEILRTVFPVMEGRPVQRILDSLELKIILPDRQEYDNGDPEAGISDFLVREGQRAFDLEQGPLLRINLLTLKPDDYILVLTEHHLIHDGWTQSVLLKEFITIFSAFLRGEPSPQQEMPLQYADFAYWQRSYFQGEILERHLEFWKKKLEPVSPVLELPVDRPRPSVISGKGAVKRVVLPDKLSSLLKEFGKQKEVTLFIVMLAVFKVLLFRNTGTGDLCVGTAAANRRFKEIESMLGMVINTIALRTGLSGDMSFLECLERVKETCMQAYEYEDTPFELVVGTVSPQRSLSHTPIFQVLFSFMDIPMQELKLQGLEISVVPSHNRSAKFDINVVVFPQIDEQAGGITIDWEYNTDIFAESTMERMLTQYEKLLEEAVGSPGRRISVLPMLDESEKQRILEEWNETDAPFPAGKSLMDLFADQVSKTPDHKALVGPKLQITNHKTVCLTYRELNRASDQLAHFLIEKGVLADTIVGIMVERSIEMIAGIMGILKAGGAYLPIEPGYPEERINFILRDSGAKILLTNQELIINCQCGALNTSVSSVSSNDVAKKTAYIIYTSGSTGKPKGVMVEHRSVVNRLNWMQRCYPIGVGDVILQKTPFTFDVSVWELFWWSFEGAALSILPHGEERNPEAVIRAVHRDKVTTMHFVPSMLNAFLEYVEESGSTPRLDSVRQVFSSGEALGTAQVKTFSRLFKEKKLVNLYGPTEATVDVSYFNCSGQGPEEPGGIPIGKPIDNIRLYVLSRESQVQPIGAPGELYIAGIGLARGYLNNPELTNEKFSSVSSNDVAKKMYKTGDLVRWLPDGNIEFLGRLDQQVKIRGFRIECGEIENRLSRSASVKEAVVLIREQGGLDRHLAAYVVPERRYGKAVKGLNELKEKGQRYELPNGMPFFYLNRRETDFMFREIVEERAYFKHGITLDKHACVFDVGANVGIFTLFVSRLCPDAEIYAFEPVPPIYETLRLNTDFYHVKAKVFNCGLADFDGTATFTYYPNASLLSGRFADKNEEIDTLKAFINSNLLTEEQVHDLLEERLIGEPFDCSLKTLSRVIAENNIQTIDLLKVDVEKGELDLLKGIKAEDWPKIRQVVLEVHNIDGRLQQIVEMLEKLGYRVDYDRDKELVHTDLYQVYAVLKDRKEGKDKDIDDEHFRWEFDPAWTPPEQLVHTWQEALRESLPDYMIPSYFVPLEQLPLTPNGKVDRKALLALSFSHTGVSLEAEAYVEPEDDVQATLAAVWSEVLGVEKIGINDNFFERGGDSIKGIQVAARLLKYRLKMENRDLFMHPTIKDLSACVHRIDRQIPQEPVRGEVELTPIQQWFFETCFVDRHHFNQSVMLFRKQGFDEKIVETVFNEITVHHDALRMVFKIDEQGTGVKQINRGLPEGKTMDMEIVELPSGPKGNMETDVEERANRIQRGMELSTGPLVKLCLFKTGEGDHLLIVIHHLVIDGVSWRILLEDFALGYRQCEAGEGVLLPPKTDSYRYWAQQLKEYGEKQDLDSELEYWGGIGEMETGKLPVDHPVAKRARKQENCGTLMMSLEEGDTRRLLQEVPQAYSTEINDILLTALGLSLKEWAGMEKNLVYLEGHGREEIMENLDLSRTVGWFTSLFPVVLDMEGERDMGSRIKAVKEMFRRIPHRGIGYGILKYLAPPEKTGNLEPEILFNYLGQLEINADRDDFFRLSELPTGRGISPEMEKPYKLEISAKIFNGQLNISFTYNCFEYEVETLGRLLASYKSHLLEIIDHCTQREQKELTPGDLFYSDFSIDELEDIKDKLYEID